jgi:Putative zinc-finger
MEGLFHLTSSLADDFLHDRLSERDQSAITLHLEKCQDCRRLRRKNGRGQECSLAITR